jgi:hypothetical protein
MATTAVQMTEGLACRVIGGQVRGGKVWARELATPLTVTGYLPAMASPILQFIFPLTTGSAYPKGDTPPGLIHIEYAKWVKPYSFLGTIAFTDW